MTDLLASPPNLNHTYFRIYENYDEALREEREWRRHDINSHDARQYWICQQTTISQADNQSMICHNVSNNCMLHETHLCRCHKISSKELIKECVGKLGQQPATAVLLWLLYQLCQEVLRKRVGCVARTLQPFR